MSSDVESSEDDTGTAGEEALENVVSASDTLKKVIMENQDKVHQASDIDNDDNAHPDYQPATDSDTNVVTGSDDDDIGSNNDEASDGTADDNAADKPVEDKEGANIQGRKRIRRPDKWKRNVRQRSRCAGDKYVTRKGKTVQEKNPLNSKCEKCRFKCKENLSEADCLTICRDYYALQSTTKSVYSIHGA